MRSFIAQHTTLNYRTTNWPECLNINVPINTTPCFKLTDFWATLYNLFREDHLTQMDIPVQLLIKEAINSILRSKSIYTEIRSVAFLRPSRIILEEHIKTNPLPGYD
jgi:hypothetical protein